MRIPISRATVRELGAGTVRALASAIMLGSARIALDESYDIEIQDLTLTTIVDRPKAVQTAVVASSIYAAGFYYVARKYSIVKRIEVVERVMRIVNEVIESGLRLGQKMEETASLIRSAGRSGMPEDVIIQTLQSSINEGDRVRIAQELLDLVQQVYQGKPVDVEDWLDTYLPDRPNPLTGQMESNTVRQIIEGPRYATGEGVDLPALLEDVKELGKKPWYGTDPRYVEDFKNALMDPADPLGYRFALEETDTYLQTLDNNFVKNTSGLSDLNVPDYMGEEFSDEARYYQKILRNAEDIQDSAQAAQTALKQQADEVAKRLGGTGLRLAGKLLYWDGILWLITGTADLLLNPFIPEEEQGFLAERTGFSFFDLLITEPLLDWLFREEQDLLSRLIEIAEQSDSVQAVVFGVIAFYTQEFDVDLTLEVPLVDVLPTPGIPDPLTTLSVITIALIGYYAARTLIIPALMLMLEPALN